MSSSSSQPLGLNGAAPRMGILVDCQRFKAKLRHEIPAHPQLPVPAAPVAEPAKNSGTRFSLRSFASWREPALALLLGLLFLLSATAGAVHGWLTLDREPMASNVPEVVAQSPVFRNVHSITTGQVPVPPAAGAKPKTKAAAETLTKQTPLPLAAPAAVPASAPAPPEETKNAPGPKSSGPSQDAASSQAKAEPVATQAPLLKLLKASDWTKDGNARPPAAATGTGDFCGTAVTFLPSPKIAGEEALKRQKLLFVLHVSGNFEDPGFT